VPAISTINAMKFRRLCHLAALTGTGCGGKVPGMGCGCTDCERIAIKTELSLRFDIAPWCRGLDTELRAQRVRDDRCRDRCLVG
jgi:hypothetical protein